MSDKITVIEDEPKPEPKIVVVAPQDKKVEKVTTERTTVVETSEKN